jgi:DNA-binding beta-propeller fold protein YncE
MGKFQRNIPINSEPRGQHRIWTGLAEGHIPDEWGTGWIGFSPDQAQKFMYVMYEHNEQVNVVDRASGRILSSFGRAGHQVGEFTHGHILAVDSKGNIYVAETGWGERVQKFKVVSSQ